MPLNFGRTTVATPPSPATSGLSFTVTDAPASGRLTTGPAILCPADVHPTPENAEIVEVSDVDGATVTLSARAQEGTSARTVAAGWQVLQGITAAMYADLLRLGATYTLDDSSVRVARINVPDDGTATATWPDRLAFYFEEEGGGFIRTGYFNEYGELRARAAKDNTVALRAMAHADNTTEPIFEVADGAQTETYFEVSPAAADFYVPVSGPNIAVDKVKPSNLTVNNSTSPQSDPHLTADLEAATTYVIEGVIQYEATQNADMRMRLVFTNDPTSLIVWSPVLQSGATSATNSVNIGARTANTNFTAGGIGAGSAITMGFQGTIVTNLATTFTLAFAQASAEVSDMIVYAGSRLSVRKAAT